MPIKKLLFTRNRLLIAKFKTQQIQAFTYKKQDNEREEIKSLDPRKNKTEDLIWICPADRGCFLVLPFEEFILIVAETV